MPRRTAACSQNADWPHQSFAQVTASIGIRGARNFGLAGLGLAESGPAPARARPAPARAPAQPPGSGLSGPANAAESEQMFVLAVIPP